jgi:plastocyanin
MKTIAKFSVLAFAALILVSCGGTAAELEPVAYTIDMKEYTFTPANLQLNVGEEVTLTMTNSGQLQHEIMFGRGVEMVNNRPAHYAEDMFEAGGVTPEVTQDIMPEEEEEEIEGFMVILPIGATATVTFPVTEGMVGEWEMGCFEQEGVHYDAGMKGPVTVSQ